jgi:hypothetical protein
LLNRELRLPDDVVSAANLSVQSWKFFHEMMNRNFRMARKANVVPSYLLHKQSGQARCRVAGKDYLLGPYGSDESRVKFGEIVSGQFVDPFVTKSPATSQAESSLTVNELVLAYMRHAEKHYVKNGQATSEIHCLKSATRPLVELYGYHSVDAFGPLALKAVREKMISSGWCRKTVNKNVGVSGA